MSHASSEAPVSEPNFEYDDEGFEFPHPDLVEVEDQGQGPRRQHQATPRPRQFRPIPASIRGLHHLRRGALHRHAQAARGTHTLQSHQPRARRCRLAGTQTRHFQQDLAHSKVRFQDFGEVRVQDFREVRIQDKNPACKGAILRADRRSESAAGEAGPSLVEDCVA